MAELLCEYRAHTAVCTLTHVCNEATGFPGKKTHVWARSASHADFALLGRIRTFSSNSRAPETNMKVATKCLLCFKYVGEQSPVGESVFSWLNDCVVLWSAFEDYQQISTGSKYRRQLPALSSVYLQRHAGHCIVQSALAPRPFVTYRQL